MTLLVLLATPLAGAGLVAAAGRRADALHVATALATAAGAGALAVQVGHSGMVAAPGWGLGADALSAFMAVMVAGIALVAAVGVPAYLRAEQAAGRLAAARARAFRPLFHLFVFTMLLAVTTDNAGLVWVAVEGTTLASVFLITLERTRASLEAAYKYLLICSVGIALALLGNFFLAAAASGHDGAPVRLAVPDLLREARTLDVAWLKAAFLLLLVGYGTKMGLAPLHTWLPDAHSEAPSVVSALLSGALLNCALLGILRAQQVCAAAGQAAFGQGLLVGFGLLSMAVAAVFVTGQSDYKRMLAYSSVEHMGILTLGIGLGGAGVFGGMLHAVNHSLTKAALYQGRAVVAIAYLAFLAVVFVGMATAVLGMAQGPATTGDAPPRRERLLAVVPAGALAALFLLLGVYIPPVVRSAVEEAARALG